MDVVFKYDSVSINPSGSAIVILDQTQLPNKEVFLELNDVVEISQAISLLKVRGAPAIGVAAAYGLYVSLLKIEDDLTIFSKEFYKNKHLLNSSRPTAVNLSYALERMDRCFILNRNRSVAEIKSELRLEADRIKEEDIEMCRRISENGLTLLHKGIRILTHCNAGHLAVSRYGTALGPIYLAEQNGLSPKVYVDETRPLLQGARLTAYELQNGGVDVTLICDNMASTLMSQGKVDIVMVGCDRIASNGDVVNKIGTSGLAILASHYGIPFYSLGPTSTIDVSCRSGNDVIIEQRDGREVTELYFKERIAPKGIDVFNPSFDITPSSLLTGIVTEKGIFRAPFSFK